MLNTDVLIPGCNVPLSLWQGAVIALAAAIWGGLKLRAGGSVALLKWDMQRNPELYPKKAANSKLERGKKSSKRQQSGVDWMSLG